MFDLDAGKLIVIGIVALIAIPSKDLPRVLRTLGQATGRMRRMAAEFQGQFMDAMREAEVADLRKEIEETNKSIMNSVKLDGAFDPMTQARKQIVDAIDGEDPQPRLGGAPSGAPTDESPAVSAAVEMQPSPAPAGANGSDAQPSDKADT